MRNDVIAEFLKSDYAKKGLQKIANIKKESQELFGVSPEEIMGIAPGEEIINFPGTGEMIKSTIEYQRLRVFVSAKKMIKGEATIWGIKLHRYGAIAVSNPYYKKELPPEAEATLAPKQLKHYMEEPFLGYSDIMTGISPEKAEELREKETKGEELTLMEKNLLSLVKQFPPGTEKEWKGEVPKGTVPEAEIPFEKLRETYVRYPRGKTKTNPFGTVQYSQYPFYVRDPKNPYRMITMIETGAPWSRIDLKPIISEVIKIYNKVDTGGFDTYLENYNTIRTFGESYSNALRILPEQHPLKYRENPQQLIQDAFTTVSKSQYFRDKQEFFGLKGEEVEVPESMRWWEEKKEALVEKLTNIKMGQEQGFDEIFIDRQGKVFNTVEELIKANKSIFDKSLDAEIAILNISLAESIETMASEEMAIAASKRREQMEKESQVIRPDLLKSKKPKRTEPKYLKSILESIVQVIPNLPLEEAKKKVIERVEASNIEEIDKGRIIDTTEKQTNMSSLLKYLYNSILFYVGLGTIRSEENQEIKLIKAKEELMLKKLAQVANMLDNKGYSEEADTVDRIMNNWSNVEKLNIQETADDLDVLTIAELETEIQKQNLRYASRSKDTLNKALDAAKEAQKYADASDKWIVRANKILEPMSIKVKL